MKVILLVGEIIGVVGIIGSIMATNSGNTMHAALWLVVAYMAISIKIILLELAIIGYLMIVIYIGGIAIIILFAIMVVEEGDNSPNTTIRNKLSYGAIALIAGIGIILKISDYIYDGSAKEISLWHGETTNAIGTALYTGNSEILIIGGVILLIAMVGAMEIIMDKLGK